MSATKLKVYRARRHLQKNKQSAEPYGKIKKTKAKEPLFVIQKHDASHLHYDLRFEVNGVLPSWAVPKGLPEKPGIRRLALPTDDHPMEYAHFEGIIPEGHYGGGTVMVWDIGTYNNIKEHNGKPVSMEQAIKEGSVEVFIKGKKIWGPFALVKTKSLTDKESWILLKMTKKIASEKKPVKKKIAKNVSVLSGRTLAQIAKDRDSVWD